MASDSSSYRPRVAIIGAGVAGLTAIKSCLEDGIEPVCYERHTVIGGLWHYDENLRPGQGAAMFRSCSFNNSKEVMSFSDFPIPREYAPYLTHSQALKFLEDYAKAFDLVKCITFNTNVIKIERNDEEGDNDRYWKLTLEKEDGLKIDEYFDYVMVCIGMFNKAFTPEYPGLDKFTGIKIHCNQYRDATPFRDKKVIVVGGAFTAGDISNDLARTANVAYLSMRHGTYVIPRILVNGLPWDHYLLTRSNYKSKSAFRTKLQACTKERILDYKMIGLQSTESIMDTHSFMINDTIQDDINQGRLVPVHNIQEFQGNDVLLSDGTILKDVDAVIFATGYEYGIPIVDRSLVYGEGNVVQLYKYMFPATSIHPERIAMIGMVEFLAPKWQAIEIQARWASKVFSGKVKLPDRETMMRDIEKNPNNPKYVDGVSKYVSGIPYMDDLAEFIGVKPNFWKLLFSDPKLAYEFEYGAIVPYFYRLQGPNAWPGARDAILNARDNLTFGTRSHRADTSK